MSTRSASHAGSWYSSSRNDLSSQLDGWLSKPERIPSSVRAVISPHAGYAYCGSCAAYAYKQVDPSSIKRIFILGPSHHYGLAGCALTSTTSYETPLYNLSVDLDVNRELMATGAFEVMNIGVDEDEHSIEMQIPYIAKVMESRKESFKIVPVLVGGTNKDREEIYGNIFSKYLADPHNFFVISSDFCHWGKRFRFTYYDKTYKSIYQSIEALDHMGMDLIENLDAKGFHTYLKKYCNTICGRHPIGIFLNAVQILQQTNPSNDFNFKFLRYAQSNQCKEFNDSSVSYAAGILTAK